MKTKQVVLKGGVELTVVMSLSECTDRYGYLQSSPLSDSLTMVVPDTSVVVTLHRKDGAVLQTRTLQVVTDGLGEAANFITRRHQFDWFEVWESLK